MMTATIQTKFDHMKAICLLLLVFIANNSLNAQLNKYYLHEKGSSKILLYFDNQNVYALYYIDCSLGFCYKSNIVLRGDTIVTDKIGSYVKKGKRIFGLSDKKEVTDVRFIPKSKIQKYIDCLKIYGIYVDSARLIIPDHLF